MFYRNLKLMPINPITRFGIYCKIDVSQHKGKINMNAYSGKWGTPFYVLKDEILEMYIKYRDELPKRYQSLGPSDFYELYNILGVIEYKAWRIPELIEFFYRHIYSGERAIIFPFVAIVFDEALVEKGVK